MEPLLLLIKLGLLALNRYIVMNKELEQTFKQELYRIKDDDDFVFGMMNYVFEDSDRIEMLEYIKQNKDVSYVTLILIGMAVYKKNHPERKLEYVD